jgi:PhzF family phenazine biosynthesis protein
MELRYKQVDVFTSVPFKGNPVAVIFDADNLSTEEMQRIANWTNISETTFLQKSSSADYKLRIFCPVHEYPFAGHPIIGSAFAAIQSQLIPEGKNEFIQECKAGLVRITKEDDFIFIRIPRIEVLDIKIDKTELSDALGVTFLEEPIVINSGPLWAVLKLDQLSDLRKMVIDVDKTYRLSGKHGISGMTVYSMVPGKGVYVRTFAPIEGTNEDPVCGSGNAAIALHIKMTGNQGIFGNSYIAFQGEALGRNGIVKVRYDVDGISIGGNAVTVIEGLITI